MLHDSDNNRLLEKYISAAAVLLKSKTGAEAARTMAQTKNEFTLAIQHNLFGQYQFIVQFRDQHVARINGIDSINYTHIYYIILNVPIQ